MEKESSLVVLFIFFIMLSSVTDKVVAKPCNDLMGDCEKCDERCKTKHGPTGKGTCEGTSNKECMCYYECGPPPPKVCYGGAGRCSQKCSNQCCNQICASMYLHGAGFCDSIGAIFLCKCQYPC
ncbi:hypothetical protein EUTSA_v10026783mg [Eutrema salsugineum]|uniref:Defensin-like protein n=1 Tax=Eutrema salsugineum TaxID=72664 RepID=V4MN01_EUTSA|nr:hypothetical protein EUTSA_v10026783mg [Eutrema salsugineum]